MVMRVVMRYTDLHVHALGIKSTSTLSLDFHQSRSDYASWCQVFPARYDALMT